MKFNIDPNLLGDGLQGLVWLCIYISVIVALWKYILS